MPTVTAQLSADDLCPLQVSQSPTKTIIITNHHHQSLGDGGNSNVVVDQRQPQIRQTPASAFQILNRDYLLGGGGQYTKPNAIVRPMNFQQIESPPAADDKQSTIGAGICQQLSAVASTGTGGKDSVTKKIYQQVNTFAKELDLKLRRLRNDKSSVSSKNSSNQDSLNKRPLFITTVPTGIFLPPIKAAHHQVKRVYAFSSHPKIFSIYRPSDYAPAGYYTNLKDSNVRVRRSQPSDLTNDKNNFRKTTTTTTTFNGFRPLNNVSVGNRREPEPYKNVMHERRIIRGSNFNQCQTQWNPYFANAGLLSGKEHQPLLKEAEARRRQTLRKRLTNRRNVIGSPPPVYGRQHENVQTEKYLEELFDRPPEFDANTQTDLFLQRPPSPPYIPAKTGVDVSTSIEDGELFNFDSEVQPILETLVGHSVKQGLIEVLHEEEMAEMKQQQEEFLALREADLAELRRLEAEELRLQAEKERRIRQDNIAKELDNKMQERVTAAKLLQGHIANLLPEVMQSLEPLTAAARKEDLERTICPWLSKEISEEVGHIVDSREILAEIIKEIVKERAKAYANYYEESDIEEIDEEEGECYMVMEEHADSVDESDK